MADKSPVTHDLTQLFDKIKDVRIAMLSTFDDSQTLHSRPMYTQKPDGDMLLFLTDAESALVGEVQNEPRVNLSYSNPETNVYASITGKASAYHDAAKIAELWSEPMRGWFPKGKEDPNIRILKVTVDKAEYWDSPSSILTQAYAYARAVVTGERSKDDDVNEHALVQPR